MNLLLITTINAPSSLPSVLFTVTSDPVDDVGETTDFLLLVWRRHQLVTIALRSGWLELSMEQLLYRKWVSSIRTIMFWRESAFCGSVGVFFGLDGKCVLVGNYFCDFGRKTRFAIQIGKCVFAVLSFFVSNKMILDLGL